MNILSQLITTLRNRRGQSIVEISLIAPLLMVALFIPADFGVAFLVANIAGTAARDGARIGSEAGKSGGNADNRNFSAADAASVKDKVVPMMPARLTNRSVRVKFYEDTPADCLETVEVTVSGDYNFFFYQILRLFGATVNNSQTISRTSQMPYRNQPSINQNRCTGTSVNQLYSNL
jgi:Flp pilus assembly protein TadG